MARCSPATPTTRDFAPRVAFVHASERPRSATGDRTRFLGRNGSLAAPAALGAQQLARRFGAGLDPCAALQVACRPRARRDARAGLCARPGRRSRHGARRCAALRATWTRRARPRSTRSSRTGTTTLGAVQVQTPDDSFDLMMNRWLLYQTLSPAGCGRAPGYFQPGGAYGFRDQLQDVMALVRRATRSGTRAPAALRRAAVPRGRRAALVARATGRGHPHALLRRPPLAALRRRPLRA